MLDKQLEYDENNTYEITTMTNLLLDVHSMDDKSLACSSVHQQCTGWTKK